MDKIKLEWRYDNSCLWWIGYYNRIEVARVWEYASGWSWDVFPDADSGFGTRDTISSAQEQAENLINKCRAL